MKKTDLEDRVNKIKERTGKEVPGIAEIRKDLEDRNQWQAEKINELAKENTELKEVVKTEQLGRIEAEERLARLEPVLANIENALKEKMVELPEKEAGKLEKVWKFLNKPKVKMAIGFGLIGASAFATGGGTLVGAWLGLPYGLGIPALGGTSNLIAGTLGSGWAVSAYSEQLRKNFKEKMNNEFRQNLKDILDIAENQKAPVIGKTSAETPVPKSAKGEEKEGFFGRWKNRLFGGKKEENKEAETTGGKLPQAAETPAKNKREKQADNEASINKARKYFEENKDKKASELDLEDIKQMIQAIKPGISINPYAHIFNKEGMKNTEIFNWLHTKRKVIERMQKAQKENPKESEEIIEPIDIHARTPKPIRETAPVRAEEREASPEEIKDFQDTLVKRFDTLFAAAKENKFNGKRISGFYDGLDELKGDPKFGPSFIDPVIESINNAHKEEADQNIIAKMNAAVEEYKAGLGENKEKVEGEQDIDMEVLNNLRDLSGMELKQRDIINFFNALIDESGAYVGGKKTQSRMIEMLTDKIVSEDFDGIIEYSKGEITKAQSSGVLNLNARDVLVNFYRKIIELAEKEKGGEKQENKGENIPNNMWEMTDEEYLRSGFPGQAGGSVLSRLQRIRDLKLEFEKTLKEPNAKLTEQDRKKYIDSQWAGVEWNLEKMAIEEMTDNEIIEAHKKGIDLFKKAANAGYAGEINNKWLREAKKKRLIKVLGLDSENKELEKEEENGREYKLDNEKYEILKLFLEKDGEGKWGNALGNLLDVIDNDFKELEGYSQGAENEFWVKKIDEKNAIVTLFFKQNGIEKKRVILNIGFNNERKEIEVNATEEINEKNDKKPSKPDNPSKPPEETEKSEFKEGEEPETAEEIQKKIDNYELFLKNRNKNKKYAGFTITDEDVKEKIESLKNKLDKLKKEEKKEKNAEIGKTITEEEKKAEKEISLIFNKDSIRKIEEVNNYKEIWEELKHINDIIWDKTHNDSGDLSIPVNINNKYYNKTWGLNKIEMILEKNDTAHVEKISKSDWDRLIEDKKIYVDMAEFNLKSKDMQKYYKALFAKLEELNK